MKTKWLAIIGMVSAAVLSADAQLVMSWKVAINTDNFGFNITNVALSSITSSSATKGTDGFGYTAVSVANFGGTGSLSVNFSGGDAFNPANWTFAAQNFSHDGGSGGKGLGVNTGGALTAQRAINGTEVILFAIDTSSLDTGENQLQFRVTGYNNAVNLYKQTGANAGTLLQSSIVALTPSDWFGVDGLGTFAIQSPSGNAQFQILEFRVAPAAPTNTPGKVNVFMLSGQSNMVRMDENTTLIPLINAAYPDDENIFVKVAQISQPISRWVPEDSTNFQVGDLYRTLYTNTIFATAGKTVDTYTCVWMQGESDATDTLAPNYESNLRTLYAQLTNDFGTVNMVIGRINDSSTKTAWNTVRQAEVTVANSLGGRGTWVDTDSFNDPSNTLHPKDANDWGYDLQGARFAEASINLINAFAPGGNVAPSAVIDEPDGVVFADLDNNGSQTVMLHGGNSSDSDGSIASWTWMQGTNTLAVGQTLNHILNVRTNVVSLIVHDINGAPDVATIRVIVIPVADQDSDGLPDDWETRYFGGPTNAVPGANPDNDAYSNLQEYVAGLNPTVADAFLITNLTAGTNISFNWNAVSGRVYRVYWSSNLVDGFAPIASNLVAGSYAAATTNMPSGFCKVEVELAP